MPTSNTVNQALAKRLYSLPAGARGNIALPGPDPASGARLVEKLLHNQEHYHTYFNDMRFHNHSTHHMFAIYALGAPPALLDAAYATHMQYQKPLVPSPHLITDEDFLDHLDEDEYYNAYLAYFLNYLDTHDITETVERFIFSPEFNYIHNLDELNARDKANGGKGQKKQPEMLNRCLASLVHPFIHIGYGIEFGVKGQLAEGLAMTAVHPPMQTPVVPFSLFSSHPDFASTPSVALLKRLASLTLTSQPASSPPPKPTFRLHQRLLADPAFAAGTAVEAGSPKKYETFIARSGDRIHALVTEWYEEWLDGATTAEEVERRLEVMVEEVVWGNVLWYGVGGWAGPGKKAGEKFNADFFLMHLVTSSHFLPTFALPRSASNPAGADPALALASRLLLVRTYFAMSVGWYVAGGRPAAPIADFYASTGSEALAPVPPPSKLENGAPQKGEMTIHTFKSALAAGGSPWPRVVQNTLVHPNEHLCKVQRALAFFSVKYGGRAAGDFKGAALPGAEKLDSSLFARVAGLTMERLGLANEGGKLDRFDFTGFYDDGRDAVPRDE
ncbi:hypothetical protein DENSPDRAFT_818604 [Dentipellis sp. KUC8613]|nr:hypothetical protein DENSPDRAFT_818604 [Dentipellis sp. KUC8613]